jgi:hypothetical protein
LLGFSTGGAASGVVVAAIPASATSVTWTWPGIFINYGALTLFLFFTGGAFNVTMTYPT